MRPTRWLPLVLPLALALAPAGAWAADAPAAPWWIWPLGGCLRDAATREDVDW